MTNMMLLLPLPTNDESSVTTVAQLETKVANLVTNHLLLSQHHHQHSDHDEHNHNQVSSICSNTCWWLALRRLPGRDKQGCYHFISNSLCRLACVEDLWEEQHRVGRSSLMSILSPDSWSSSTGCFIRPCYKIHPGLASDWQSFTFLLIPGNEALIYLDIYGLISYF